MNKYFQYLALEIAGEKIYINRLLIEQTDIKINKWQWKRKCFNVKAALKIAKYHWNPFGISGRNNQ